MKNTKTNVERRLCKINGAILDAIWEDDKVLLESGGLSEEQLMDVRISDFGNAEKLSGIIRSMITKKKLCELLKNRWDKDPEVTYTIRLTGTDLTSEVSEKGMVG